MKTSWVIGNWKLNPATKREAVQLLQTLNTLKTEYLQNADANSMQLMIAPSFLHLDIAATYCPLSSGIMLASQDVSAFSGSIGAYTGDVSARQLADVGVKWVIIGHSERRQYMHESNETLLAKIWHAHQQSLGVIFCIGETQAQYEAGQTKEVLIEQLNLLQSFLEQVNQSQMRLIVAYEPVWAIGTGQVPSPKIVDGIHSDIREVLTSFNTNHGHLVPIIYGGSVKPNNARGFATCDAVDGVLVGGASLDAQSFVQIAQAFA